jgi:DnaJ-domain-containing protein 1
MRDILSWSRFRVMVRKRGLVAARSARGGDGERGAVTRHLQAHPPRSEANHYDLLDVSKDASNLEIRSAYLRLIKECHPDREDRLKGARGSAAELNAAYWVLRDPVRRARYDDALQEEKREWAFARSAQPAPLVPIPSRQSREVLAAGALLAVITAFVIFGQRQVEERQRATATAARLSRPSLEREAPWLPVESRTLNESAVAEAASAATAVSTDEALRHSKSCFAQVTASRDLKILDYCVAFDTSVALWNPDTASGGDKPGYFHILIRQARHAEALFPFFSTEKEAEARRLAIEAASVAQLAHKLAEQAGRGQSPAPVALESQDARTGEQGFR